MDTRRDNHQWEVSSSLTPALDGAPRSKSHTNRSEKKGRMLDGTATGTKKRNPPLLEESQER